MAAKKKYTDEDAAEEQEKLWNSGSATLKTSSAYAPWFKKLRNKLEKHVRGSPRFVRFYHKP